MNIVLLSGGSGKRLWPLSNDIRSKQFIKIFKTENDEYESMVQRVYKQIISADENSKVTIATAKTQVSSIKNQIEQDIGICVEPSRKDTFPAIALATAFLHDEQKVDENEVVIVCPVDPYVNQDYFNALNKLEETAKTGDANLVLMGIDPTYPSEKYGYIIPCTKEDVSKVKSFKEKPDLNTAKEYIEKGALWNGGVFAFKLKYLLDIAHKYIDFKDYKDLFEKYNDLNKISFDYAVVEKENNISVTKFKGQWKDLGTWNTLTEAMENPTIGNATLNEKCENVHVINELDLPVLCMGLKNMIVAVSPDGILVSDKNESSYIKPFVDKIENPVMFAEKSWGSYKVIDIDDKSLTIKVTLRKGCAMNYHSHERREEYWTIVEGKGKILIDDVEKEVKVGDIVEIPVGAKHKITAITEIKLIETQVGENIHVSDKQKFN